MEMRIRKMTTDIISLYKDKMQRMFEQNAKVLTQLCMKNCNKKNGSGKKGKLMKRIFFQ